MNNQELREAGLKVTLPRLKILQLFEQGSKSHLSAEAIYQCLKESGEDVGLATVYRVLTQFVTAGLVIRHNFENDHAVFELNQGEHHDHLVCVKCGRVEEFVDKVIEEHQHKIAKKAKFKMTHHSLNIYGFCGQCQA